MSSRDEVQAQADVILREAAKPERLWPIALVVLALYVGGSLWSFVRPLGDSGREAVLHATPTLWVPALILAVLIGSRVAGRAEVSAGGSPWRWPRIARRALTALAFALPVISFGIVPIVSVLAVDAGSTSVATPLSLVTAVSVEVR